MAPEPTGGATLPAPGTAGQQQQLGTDTIDPVAAKAALELVDKMKTAGIDNPDGVLDLVKNLREFEKGAKLPKGVQKQIDDLTAKAKAAEDAKLTDTEKLTKELAELRSSLETNDSKSRQRVGKAALKAAAAAAGAIDAGDAALIDPGIVEFDDEGNATNAEALVAELKKSKPHLFGTPRPGSFDGGARGTKGEGTADMESLLRSAAGH